MPAQPGTPPASTLADAPDKPLRATEWRSDVPFPRRRGMQGTERPERVLAARHMTGLCRARAMANPGIRLTFGGSIC